VSHPHDDADPVEHDPTGMRALLGSLPDPGPMPPDLVARIEAALAEEARSRAGWPAPVAPERAVTGDLEAEEAAEGDVVPLRRRSRWPVVAVAASVLGVLGLGGVVLETLRPGGLTASIGVEDSAAGGSGSADAPSEAVRGARTLLAEDDGLGVVVLASGTSYSSAALADEVRRSLPWDGTGRDPSSGPGPKAADNGVAAGLGRLAAPAGARSCADGLGVPVRDTVVVDLAGVDDRPAAVLVATSESGGRTGWAVARTCSKASPGVLTGPVAVE
jgi:hypothetical protein